MCQTKDRTRRKKIQEELQTYKNNLLKLIRTSKFNHYNNYFQENRLNSIRTCERSRDIINITKKSKNNINSVSVQVNSKDITDAAIIANKFNNHFTTIAKQIEAESVIRNFYFSNYLSEPTTIPNNFLNLVKNQLSKPISLLAHISFNT